MVRNSLPRFLLGSAIVLGLSGFGVSSASAAVHNRIVAPASRGSYVAIPDTVHPKARLGSDLGPTSGDTLLRGMSIRFNMTDAQQAALDQLLADQQNPESPRYHQWLTPAQFGADFGLSSTDLATVSAWLTSQGFTVTGVANGGTYITFDGTVAQAEAAFGTSIHNLSVNGETHFANVTNISVPSAFAGVVTTVMGLHNFRLKPRVNLSSAQPDFTSSVSGNHYIAPGDIYAIYNVQPLLTAGIQGAGVGTGASCHSLNSLPCGDIAVIGQVDINTADIAAFRSASGLSTTQLPTTVHANGYDPGPPVCTSCNTGPNQGDLAESSIDLEWSGAMAPAASVLFVNGHYVIPDAISWAIDDNLAPIVTSSYGLCEAGWGYTEMLSLNTLFKQGNAQGQTILSASADQGAADCDAGPSASQGLQVDFPGSSPYVTSVGGTMFNDGTATGATNYWLGTDGTFSAGSAVPGATYSATGYIPEAAWNDASYGSFGGSGGGASAFFIKPTWQVGTPADAARDVPDLSLNASDAHDSLLLCVNVSTANGAQSCGNGFRTSLSDNTLHAEGGTSFDSQILGGLLALVEQKIGSRIGNANPTIYALANSHFYAAGQNTLTNSTVVFNDVTTGNNAMACTAGTASCANGGTEGFNAGTGYDLATGWGSVNVTNLANDWALVTPLGVGTLGSNVSTTNLTASPGSVTAGATVTLTATVTGTSVAPAGTVTFLANNVSLGTVALPSNGIATYSWVTSCSALGQQVMSASYSGDVNYQGSRGPVLTANGGTQTSSGSTITSPLQVQVTTNACPDFSITPSAATVTVAAGGSIPPVTITATAVNNFTGTVTFSAVGTSTSGYAPTFTFSPTTLTLPTSSPTTSLTLSGITAALHIPNAPGRDTPARHESGSTPWYIGGSGVTVASLLLLVLPRRRRLGGLLLVVLAIGLIGGATGCGGSSQTTPPTTTVSTNPYVGVYTVTVIGTYTSSNNQVTQHSTIVTYNIN
jgi:subtilase family serine protease